MSDDLVQRLRVPRDLPNASDDYLDLLDEAADRIEAQGTKIGLYAKLLDEHHERIGALEDRINTLEVALRAISETTDNQYYFWCKTVALRALEGKS